MDKIDLKKSLRHLYDARAGDFVELMVPSMTFLKVDGQGDPNTSQAYTSAVEWLYGVSYAMKFAAKASLGLDAARFCNTLSRHMNLPEMYIVADSGEDASLLAEGTGYRLPTEAEWEHACRAGTPGPRYGHLADIAWYRDNSEGAAMPVGQKRPNGWGLHDMLGNVWEWCSDVYDPYIYGTYRVFRGGGWADNARGCLATNRRRSHPSFKIDDLGFRVARSLR